MKKDYTVIFDDGIKMKLSQDHLTGLLDAESIKRLSEKLEWPLIEKARISLLPYQGNRAEIIIKPKLPKSWEQPKFYSDDEILTMRVSVLESEVSA